MQQSDVNYIKPSDLEKGMALTAVYDGTSIGGKYNSTTHYFKEESGEITGINGTSELNKKLSLINKGDTVKILYRGMKEFKTAHGVATSHDFSVKRVNTDGSEELAIINQEGPQLVDPAEYFANVSNGSEDAESLRA